jgi:hypothetical protein
MLKCKFLKAITNKKKYVTTSAEEKKKNTVAYGDDMRSM